jgi:hypothetical protein
MTDIVNLAICYMLFMGFVHLALIMGLSLILTPVLWWGAKKYLKVVLDVCMFNGLLLLSGVLSNAIWNIFVYGKLYASDDYVGLESSPFWLVFPPNSYLGLPWFAEGWSASEVRMLWIPFAVAAWVIAIIAFIWLRLFLSKKTYFKRL